MSSKKEFDCLRMKDAIQAQLRDKWRKLTREQIRQGMSQFLADSDNAVAAWWRGIRDASKISDGKVKRPKTRS